jgi:hypothetical protein
VNFAAVVLLEKEPAESKNVRNQHNYRKQIWHNEAAAKSTTGLNFGS